MTATLVEPRFIARAPGSLAGWVALFRPQNLCVLPQTAEALEELRENEDGVDAHLLAEVVSADPLMLLKLLAHVAELRRGREGSDTETATECLVMLGIPPFFRHFGPQPTVTERLAAQPEAMDGFRRVLRKSRRAADFAMGFAVHRMDHDAAVLHEAALLHDFAELLLWLHAPALAVQMAQRQEADPTLRSALVQREVLGTTLAELQHALMLAWRLPALLVHITDNAAPGRDAQMRNVQLAIRIARHSSAGWDNPALPDDVRETAALLNMGEDATLRLLHEIDDT
jgi:HD-like signal output (HDOD) protein